MSLRIDSVNDTHNEEITHLSRRPSRWQELYRVSAELFRRGVENSPVVASLTARRTVNSLNALALASALDTILSAYPNAYLEVNGVIYVGGVGMCLGQLALEIAHSRTKEIKLSGKEISMEKLYRIIDSVNTGANTFYFSLIATVAVFVALYAEITGIGEEKIDVPNLLFALIFLLPNSMIAVAHAMLEYHKEAWQESRALLGRFAKWMNELMILLCNSGTIYTLFMPLVLLLGFNDTGDINPFERLAIAAGAFWMGLLTMAVRYKDAGHSEVLTDITDSLSTVAYLTQIFSARSRAEMGETNTRLMISGVTGIGLLALISSILYPARKEEMAQQDRLMAAALLDTASSAGSPASMFHHVGSDVEQVFADTRVVGVPNRPVSPTNLGVSI